MTSDTTKAAFADFRDDLDDGYDRRERLIKASRDVTNASKKIIFLLHRVAADLKDGDKDGVGDAAQRAAKQASGKLKEVREMFKAMKPDLVGDRFWRHARCVSPGLQEYIEALSFSHYLEHETLITYDEVQRTLSDDDGTPYFPLTVEDYLLGLSDLTGECMRYAIGTIPRKGGRARAVAARFTDDRTIPYSDFEAFVPHLPRELRKKQRVTASSLEKIEDAVYAITVRTAEYDLPPEMLDDIVASLMSGAMSIQRGDGRDRGDRQRRDDDDDD